MDKTYTLPAIPICPACRSTLERFKSELGHLDYVCWSEDCPFTEMIFSELNLLRIMQWMDGEGPCRPIRSAAVVPSPDMFCQAHGHYPCTQCDALKGL